MFSEKISSMVREVAGTRYGRWQTSDENVFSFGLLLNKPKRVVGFRSFRFGSYFLEPGLRVLSQVIQSAHTVLREQI